MTEPQDEITRLEELAEALLAEKRSYRSRRPIVIEFCGTPKAGKSSCISSLVIFLKRNGFKVRVLTERASVCPINNKFDPNFNVWTACSALAELVHVLSNDSKKYDVVILDRGVFDAVCWFHWQENHSYLDERHYEVFREFFFAERWASKIDIVYILKADAKTALGREYSNLLTRKSGSVMNRRVISSYNTAVDECERLYSDRFREVRSIRTDDILQNDVSFKVTNDILIALGDLISEKIGFIDRVLVDDDVEVFPISELPNNVSMISYGRRAEIEADRSVIQPIPAAVIASRDLSRVLVVRKFNKATKRGSPERSRDLFYFGGHVRLEDSLGHGTPAEVFRATLSRELKEELGVDLVPDMSSAICIVDQSRGSEKKHFGVVVLCKVDFEEIQFSGDDVEFRESSLRVVRQDEMANLGLRPERWSQVIIQQILGWTFI